ncbi:MAG: hypothetical protein POELPBGB_03988 [Bacteroidia bacterium]|nr:hypothetical protein [Bacteroidia bacterium]
MTAAGALRHRVILQTVTETRDAVGGVVESWATTATVWAAVEPLRGREFFQARAEQAGVDTRIRVRYRTGLTPKMRVSWGTHTYDIEAVIEPDSRRRELHLMCSEVL